MRVASVGFWHLHGKDYAQEAAEHPDVELVAVWDPDHARRRDAAAEYGVPGVDDLQVILDDAGIDGVIICTATSDHREVILRCIAAGKHVFTEKVLAASPTDAEDIAAAARDAGRVLMVSMWRSDKGYARQIAEMVACGTVGTVTSARIRDGHPFALPFRGHPHGVLPDQFYDRSSAQGGIVIDLCHPLYLAAMILGRPASVTALMTGVTGRAVEDNAVIVLGYPGGLLATAETSSVTRVSPFTIEVHGTSGSILYSEPGIGALVGPRIEGIEPPSDHIEDAARLRIRETHPHDGGWVDVEVASDQPTALSQWVELVRVGGSSEANVELALGLTSLVAAAYESAARGRTVAVSDL